MRKILLFSLITAMCSLVMGQTDDFDHIYKNEIRAGFFQFFMNTFYLEYERHLAASNTSIVVTSGATMKKDNSEEVYGGQFGLQYRILVGNFQGEALMVRAESGYFAPFARYRYFDVTDYDGADFNGNFRNGPIYNTYQNFGGGILLGLKVLAFDRLVFDINIGGGIQYTDTGKKDTPDYASEIFGLGYTGVFPAANFTFGFRF